MKLFFALSILVVVATAAFMGEDSELKSVLKKHNQPVDMGTWIAGNTPISELSQKEFQNLLGDRTPADIESKVTYSKKTVQSNEESVLMVPKFFDWRKRSPECVGAIRNQLSCGSCWSFATTESVQDRTCIATRGRVSSGPNYAPQDVIECNFANAGCGGGSFQLGGYAAATHGISLETCNPYNYTNLIACPSTCPSGSTDNFRTYCKNSTYYYSNEVDENVAVILNDMDAVKKEVLKHGPMYISMEVYADFSSYTSGIYQHVTGAYQGNHAVKVLGWGYDSVQDQEYWIAANSWGTGWGENGFFNIYFGDCSFGKRAFACAIDVNRVEKQLQLKQEKY